MRTAAFFCATLNIVFVLILTGPNDHLNNMTVVMSAFAIVVAILSLKEKP